MNLGWGWTLKQKKSLHLMPAHTLQRKEIPWPWVKVISITEPFRLTQAKQKSIPGGGYESSRQNRCFTARGPDI